MSIGTALARVPRGVLNKVTATVSFLPKILGFFTVAKYAPLLFMLGCGGSDSSSVRDDLQNGGVPIHPPGGSSVDGNLFSGQEITSGTTGFDFFEDISGLTLTSQWISDKNLQNQNLYIAWGSNSAWIDGMPSNICYPDLINTTQLSEEDIALMEQYNEEHPDAPIYLGCPQDAFQTWEVCPDDLGNRAHLYLGEVTVKGYQYDGNETTLIGEETTVYTKKADLHHYDPVAQNTTDSEGNPLTVTPLGVICGTYELGTGGKPEFLSPNFTSIPPAYYSTGQLYMEVTVRLLRDVRHISVENLDPEKANNWRTTLEAWVQSHSEI